MNWQEFTLENSQNWPLERRYVLVITRPVPEKGLPQAVAVGYLRLHSVPFFVVPGIGGEVTHFCDCLGDDYKTPILLNAHQERWQQTNGEWGKE